jgi:hypothetical protein
MSARIPGTRARGGPAAAALPPRRPSLAGECASSRARSAARPSAAARAARAPREPDRAGHARCLSAGRAPALPRRAEASAPVRVTRHPTPWGHPACAPRAPATRLRHAQAHSQRGRRLTASQWNGTPRSAAAAASRCTAPPGDVVANMTAARRSPGQAGARTRRRRLSRRSRRASHTLESSPLQLARRLAYRRMLDRATTRRPGGPPARPNTACCRPRSRPT